MTNFVEMTITRDFLFDNDEHPSTIENEKGRTWYWDSQTTTPDSRYIAYAYDDDGECYYSLLIKGLDESDDDDLENAFNILQIHAGVTQLRFPHSPHLNVS